MNLLGNRQNRQYKEQNKQQNDCISISKKVIIPLAFKGMIVLQLYRKYSKRSLQQDRDDQSIKQQNIKKKRQYLMRWYYQVYKKRIVRQTIDKILCQQFISRGSLFYRLKRVVSQQKQRQQQMKIKQKQLQRQQRQKKIKEQSQSDYQMIRQSKQIMRQSELDDKDKDSIQLQDKSEYYFDQDQEQQQEQKQEQQKDKVQQEEYNRVQQEEQVVLHPRKVDNSVLNIQIEESTNINQQLYTTYLNLAMKKNQLNQNIYNYKLDNHDDKQVQTTMTEIKLRQQQQGKPKQQEKQQKQQKKQQQQKKKHQLQQKQKQYKQTKQQQLIEQYQKQKLHQSTIYQKQLQTKLYNNIKTLQYKQQQIQTTTRPINQHNINPITIQQTTLTPTHQHNIKPYIQEQDQTDKLINRLQKQMQIQFTHLNKIMRKIDQLQYQ